MNTQLLTVFLLTGISSAALADEAGFNLALDKGKTFIENGKNAEAFEQLQQAVKENPSRHESYFLLAWTSYRMDNLEGAADYAKVALDKVPTTESSARGEITELITVIAEKREFMLMKEQGDEAFNAGLFSKAAELYRKAYLLFPNQGSVGLRAAEIYINRLEQPLIAATLWNKIVASTDQKSAGEAKEKLTQHSDELENLYERGLAVVKGTNTNWWVENALSLNDAFPNREELQLVIAEKYAGVNNSEKAIEYLSKAVRIGATASKIAEKYYFRKLLGSSPDVPLSEFEAYLSDSFGAELPARMRREFNDDHARFLKASRKMELKNQQEIKRLQEYAEEKKKEKEKEKEKEDFLRRSLGR